MQAAKSPLDFSSSPPRQPVRPTISALGGHLILPPSAASKSTHPISSSPLRHPAVSPGRRARLDEHFDAGHNNPVRGMGGAYTPVRPPKRRPTLAKTLAGPGTSSPATTQVVPSPSSAAVGRYAGPQMPPRARFNVRPPPTGVKLSRLTTPSHASRRPIPPPFFCGKNDDALGETPKVGLPVDQQVAPWRYDPLRRNPTVSTSVADTAAFVAPRPASGFPVFGGWLQLAKNDGIDPEPMAVDGSELVDGLQSTAAPLQIEAPSGVATSRARPTKVSLPASSLPNTPLVVELNIPRAKAIAEIDTPSVTAEKRETPATPAISALSEVLQAFDHDGMPEVPTIRNALEDGGDDIKDGSNGSGDETKGPRSKSPLLQVLSNMDSDDISTDPELLSFSSDSDDSDLQHVNGEARGYIAPFWPDNDFRMWVCSSIVPLSTFEAKDPMPGHDASAATSPTSGREPVRSREPLTGSGMDEGEPKVLNGKGSIYVSLPDASGGLRGTKDAARSQSCTCQPVIKFAFGGSIASRPCTCSEVAAAPTISTTQRLPPSNFASSPRCDIGLRSGHRLVRTNTLDGNIPSITITHAPLCISSSYPELPLLSRALFNFRPELLEDRADEARLGIATPRPTSFEEVAKPSARGDEDEAVASGFAATQLSVSTSVDTETNGSSDHAAAHGSPSIGLTDVQTRWDEALAKLIRIRNLQDARAFFELSKHIDDFLSDFLNFKHLKHVEATFNQLSALLYMAAHPARRLEAIGAASPRLREIEIDAVSPPSLRAEALVLPDSLRGILPAQEQNMRRSLAGAFLHLQSMERLFDIIVSGFSCLLADARMPHNGPLALALFCGTLHRRLNWAIGIYPSFYVASASTRQVFSASGSSASGSGPSQGRDRQQQPPSMLPEPASVFIHALQKEYKSALQRGYLVRDQISRLTAIASPRRKSPFGGGGAKPTREQQKLEELQSIARGEVTEEELRDKQRKLAVRGSPRHVFVSIGAVRFLGELYKARLLPLSAVRDWLRRLLFDTTRPEIPSVWELECACALLITCGEFLEKDVQPCRCASSSPASASAHPGLSRPSLDACRLAPPTTPSLELRCDPTVASTAGAARKDGAPASHWIHCAPPASPGRKASHFSPRQSRCYLTSPLPDQVGHDLSTPLYTPSSPLYGPTETEPLTSKGSGGCTCDGVRTLDRALEKLVRVCSFKEFDVAVKEWVQAVIDLREQKWHPLATKVAAQEAFVYRPKELQAARAQMQSERRAQ